MAWYYNTVTGVVKDIPTNKPAELLEQGLTGPFSSKDAAVAFFQTHGAQAGWAEPVDPDGDSILEQAKDKVGDIIDGAKDAIGDVVDAATNPLEALNPFRNLNLQVWFIRIGEIILGTVLIGVALAKLTGADNAIRGLATTALNAAGIAATGGGSAVAKTATKAAGGAAKAAKGATGK